MLLLVNVACTISLFRGLKELVNTLGKGEPSYIMVKKWSALFNASRTSVDSMFLLHYAGLVG